MGLRGTPIERFWRHVERVGECWLWTAKAVHTKAFPYGLFNAGNKRIVRAHRFSFEMANGPIPDGLSVLHHCDNPRCVRPAHLFLGTQKDNIVDMWAKGRGRPDTLSAGRKLRWA